MVPSSLYLGFAASIIWVGQVGHISAESNLYDSLACFPSHICSFARGHISLLLLTVTQMITICLKEQLLDNLMDCFGGCLPVTRCSIYHLTEKSSY